MPKSPISSRRVLQCVCRLCDDQAGPAAGDRDGKLGHLKISLPVQALSKKFSPNAPKTLGESQMPATHYLETSAIGSEKPQTIHSGEAVG
ncbi:MULTISPECIES: hypothetical protein [Pseudomonas]|uniref:hypothetical protein n=1 Tax=Pseudomonas TaxID=286 RepID=UPI0010C0C418|nr:MULTISPECIES: hypothetical protein [Pseudomonas]MBO2923525.1 hypothetical protein [Pseudomonas asiatica]MDM9554785.1 hypothetical protein [Pseudomonas asiatica]WPU62143.1 hypothetical protein SQW15_09275 [Pseudomonas asiatica]